MSNKTAAELMLEKISRDTVHKLKGKRAAFRLLQGALILGHVSLNDELKQSIIKLANEDGYTQTSNVNEFLELLNEGSAGIKGIREKYRIKSLDQKGGGILVIDDEYAKAGWKDVLIAILPNMEIKGLESKNQINKYLKNKNDWTCIFVDLKFPNDENEGLSIIQSISKGYPYLPIIAFTATDSVDYAKKAFDNGAWYYFTKEPSEGEFRFAVDYYIKFHEIISTLISYYNEFTLPLWTKIKILEEGYSAHNNEFGAGHRKVLVESIKRAYKRLIGNKVGEHTIKFLEMDSQAESVQASANALEVRLDMLMNKHQIHIDKKLDMILKGNQPKIIETEVIEKLLSLGKKISSLENSKKFTLKNNWFKKASFVIKLRNKVAHSSYLHFSSKKYKIQNPVSEKEAKEVLINVLYLVEELDKLETPAENENLLS